MIENMYLLGHQGNDAGCLCIERRLVMMLSMRPLCGTAYETSASSVSLCLVRLGDTSVHWFERGNTATVTCMLHAPDTCIRHLSSAIDIEAAVLCLTILKPVLVL